MEFIKFLQPDPMYGGKNGTLSSEVIVQVGQIVKIEPLWFEETAEGDKFRSYVGKPDSETLERALQKEYKIYDSLGNAYFSHTASEVGQRIIEKLWLEAR